MKRIGIVLVCFCATACGNRPEGARYDDRSSLAAASSPSDEGDLTSTRASLGGYQGANHGGYAYRADEHFDETRARDTAEDELAGDTYVGASMAYGCTEDCSGHEAGWGYQGRNGYGSPYSGRSQSFQEGRQAFDEAVDDRVEEMRQDFEDSRENGDNYDY